MQAYCMKCKGSKEMKEEQKVELKNGRPAVQGKCVDCGTKMTKIVKA